MMVNRRTFVRTTLAGLGSGWLLTACQPDDETPDPAQHPQMPVINSGPRVSNPASGTTAYAVADAARLFLEAMGSTAPSRFHFDFADAERFRWHWTTPGGFPRNGMPLAGMTSQQRSRAMDLLAASLSAEGYTKTTRIMALESILGGNPDLYYVRIFGQPFSETAWGWSFNGHHLAHNFTLVAETVRVTPFFLGAHPTRTATGLRPMAREEDAARELINTLTGEFRQRAIFQTAALGTHVTQNLPVASPPPRMGLPVAEMTATQQSLVTELLHTYLGVHRPDVGRSLLERLQIEGTETLRFGWAGATNAGQPYYFVFKGHRSFLNTITSATKPRIFIVSGANLPATMPAIY